jgi:hypothetical protein
MRKMMKTPASKLEFRDKKCLHGFSSARKRLTRLKSFGIVNLKTHQLVMTMVHLIRKEATSQKKKTMTTSPMKKRSAEFSTRTSGADS